MGSLSWGKAMAIQSWLSTEHYYSDSALDSSDSVPKLGLCIAALSCCPIQEA